MDFFEPIIFIKFSLDVFFILFQDLKYLNNFIIVCFQTPLILVNYGIVFKSSKRELC